MCFIIGHREESVIRSGWVRERIFGLCIKVPVCFLVEREVGRHDWRTMSYSAKSVLSSDIHVAEDFNA